MCMGYPDPYVGMRWDLKNLNNLKGMLVKPFLSMLGLYLCLKWNIYPYDYLIFGF